MASSCVGKQLDQLIEDRFRIEIFFRLQTTVR